MGETHQIQQKDCFELSLTIRWMPSYGLNIIEIR